MDAAAELERNPISKHQIQPLSMEMSRLTRDGTAEPISRDEILRRKRGQGKIIFPCSANHEQDWQPYPVDPYPCYSVYYIILYYVMTTQGVRHSIQQIDTASIDQYVYLNLSTAQPKIKILPCLLYSYSWSIALLLIVHQLYSSTIPYTIYSICL